MEEIGTNEAQRALHEREEHSTRESSIQMMSNNESMFEGEVSSRRRTVFVPSYREKSCFFGTTERALVLGTRNLLNGRKTHRSPGIRFFCKRSRCGFHPVCSRDNGLDEELTNFSLEFGLSGAVDLSTLWTEMVRDVEGYRCVSAIRFLFSHHCWFKLCLCFGAVLKIP